MPSREILNERYKEAIDLFCQDPVVTHAHVDNEYIEEMLKRDKLDKEEIEILAQLYAIRKYPYLHDLISRNRGELMERVQEKFPELYRDKEKIIKEIIAKRELYKKQLVLKV